MTTTLVDLTPQQAAQLRQLKTMRAVTEATAVDRRNCWAGLPQLNMVMLGGVLFSRKLVGRVEKKAQFGEPARRLYYLTRAGFEAVDMRKTVAVIIDRTAFAIMEHPDQDPHSMDGPYAERTDAAYEQANEIIGEIVAMTAQAVTS